MDNKSPTRRRQYFNQTFESSLIESGPQKFTLQKSVIKGIKQNDVGKIVDVSNQGQLQEKQRLYDQHGQASSGVVQVRTRYDQIKTQSKQTAENIEKMRGKIQLLKADQTKYQSIYDNQKNELDSVNHKLQHVTTSMEDTTYQKDVYFQMLQNLKRDIITLKKRYFDMDIVFNRDRTKLKTLRSQAFTKKKLGQSCRKMLQDVQKTVSYKQKQRSGKINSFHEVLDKKQENMRRKSEREKQVQEVMLIAMTQKTQQEKEWQNIFVTNKFLKGMLKIKMENLMMRYKQIESAFQTIKLETGTNHADQFVIKFLSKQKTYGKMLDSISDKQAKLNNLKAEKEMLQQEKQQLIYKQQQIDQVHKSISLIPQNLQKKMENYNSQLLLIERQRVSIYQWSIKNLACLLGLPRRDSLYKKYSRRDSSQNLKRAFIDSLVNVKQFLDNLQKQPEFEKKIDQAYVQEASGIVSGQFSPVKSKTMTEEAQYRNLRVKTVETGDFQNEGGNDQFQDHDMAYDDISEIDYLNHYRRAIKKNGYQNKRFRIKTKPY